MWCGELQLNAVFLAESYWSSTPKFTPVVNIYGLDVTVGLDFNIFDEVFDEDESQSLDCPSSSIKRGGRKCSSLSTSSKSNISSELRWSSSLSRERACNPKLVSPPDYTASLSHLHYSLVEAPTVPRV
jgi:hypothetical protein